MLRKRNTPALEPPAKKRRKTAYTIEEIKFDSSAREDYLTGFHKRKLQRIKIAKKEAAKKEREERIEARRILRDERKADLEKHVQEVDSMVAETLGFDSDEETKADVEPTNVIGGMEEELDREEEYVDEDRFTTVTVEAVDVSRDGLHKVIQKQNSENPDDIELSNIPSTNGAKEAQNGRLRRAKEQLGGVKKKKKKFKYETKAERKVTRYKERSGNKKQAIARKM